MLLTVVGSGIRVEQFGWRRSLWLDEALVTANIVGRNFAGLMHPLSGQQGAPVGWLWAERAAVLTLGNNEYALRVVPLVAGLASIVLVWAVARRLLGPWPAVVAVAAVALSPAAIRYSVEVKQYSSDLAIALGLILLALRVDRDRGLRAWSVAGLAAVWWSHPAVFVMLGTLPAVWLAARDARRVLGACAPWVVSFAVDWLVTLRALGHDAFLHSYWAAGFAPRPLRIRTALPWLWRATTGLVRDPGNFPVAALTAIVVGAGLAALLARGRAPATAVVGPVIVGFGAAIAGRYPLEGRMALWMFGVAAIGVAAVAAELARTRMAGLAALLSTALLISPAARVAGLAHDPTTWSDIRPLLQAVHSQLHPGDVVWAHAEDAPSAEYYAISAGVPLTGALYNAPPGAACAGSQALADAAAGRRVWFVYGYHASTAPAAEEDALYARLATVAHLEATIARPQATAWLWDFGAAPDAEAPAADAGVLGCIGVVPVAVRPSGLGEGPLGSGPAT